MSGASVGGGKSQQSQNSQQTTNQELDPTLRYNLEQNYLRQAQTTLPSYGGPNLDLSKGLESATSLMGYHPQQVSASGYSPSLINRGDIRTISAGQLKDTNLDPYLNPYTKDVIDATSSDLSRQYGIDSAAANAKATAAGAFGGSRSGILGGQVYDAYNRNLNSTVAGLRNTGFVNAQGAAMGDINNRLSADNANAGYDFNVANNNAGAQNQAGQFNAAAQNQAALANQAGDLSGAGVRAGAAGMFGTLAGNQYAANYGQYNDAVNHQIQLQQLWNQALGLMPSYGSTTTYGNGNTGGTQASAGFSYGGK